MTSLSNRFAAVTAACFVMLISFASIVTVPPAQAAPIAIAAPALA